MKSKILKLILSFTVIGTLALGTFGLCFASEEDPDRDVVDFTTKYFNVTVDVNKDNSYSVTENIRVDFGKGLHHGIYRTISNQGVHIYNIYVPDVKFDDYIDGDDVVIKIGQEDKNVTGEQEYTIKYKMQIVSNLTKDTNFLRLNLLPNNWLSPIEESHAHIMMPKNTDLSKLSIYSGAAGSKTNAAGSVFETNDQNGRFFEIYTSNLGAKEGVTIELPLPEGYWEGEHTVNWALYFAIGLILFIPLVIFIMWITLGRKPKMVKTVEFYPPEGMTPGEVGYIIDGEVDRKDLTSMIIYFADKGYLTIKEYKSKKYMLKKEKEIDENEKLFAKTLFKGLFVNGEEVKLQELKEDFSQSFLNAKDFLKSEKRVYSVKSEMARGIATILLAGLFEMIAGLTILFEEYTSTGFIMGVPVAILAFVSCMVTCSALDRKMSDSRIKTLGKFIIGIIIFILSAGVVVAMLISYSINSALAIGFVLAAGISFLLICKMLSRTKESTEELGKILGLREFIKVAEKPRLIALVEEDPEYFFKVMPYAYVLGLSDKWIKDFDDIKIESPRWYDNGYDRNFVFNAFLLSSLMRGCNSAISNNVIIPSRVDGIGSGFGGGSFSGGGFGGGGGGAW